MARPAAPSGVQFKPSVHWMSCSSRGLQRPLRSATRIMNPTCAPTSPSSTFPLSRHALDALGRPRFHARQIFQWIHRHGVVDFDAMSDLGRELRGRARRRDFTHRDARMSSSGSGRPTAPSNSCCGSRDGKLIESVFIPDIRPTATRRHARSACRPRSGCAMRCAFCLTGKMGIDPQPHGRRNRRAGARARARARTCSPAASTSS